MKTLLASAPHRDTFGYSMPPPGLLRLGGALRRAGHRVELEDLSFRLARGELPADDRLAEACAAWLLRPDRVNATDRGGVSGRPDVIGLSVMGATLPIGLAIGHALRARLPGVRLILGGPGLGGIDRSVLERFPDFDAVVRGEGEVTLCELLETWQRGDELEGVCGTTWRNRESGAVRREAEREPLRDLAAAGLTPWDMLPPLEDYKRINGEVEGLTPIDSGRGCVYDCSFCSIGRYWRRRSRTLPPEALVAEIQALRGMPGAKTAYLCHDIFGADRREAVAFCELLMERRVGMAWECRARADHLDRELLELMGRSGCTRVLLGVESADARVRARNQKAMRTEIDFLSVVDDCAQAGITPILSLILGLPGEEQDGLRASLDLCAEASLHAGINISLHLVNPQPGCALGEELGPAARRIEGIPPDMAWGAGETLPERRLIDAHPDLFTTWALLPQPEQHLRDLHAISDRLPELLMRYPRTFALLRLETGLDTLDLYRRWAADGRSFESFSQEQGDDLLTDCLRWEQALVRAGAQGPGPSARPAKDAADLSLRPQRAAEILSLDHDVAQLAQALCRAERPQPSQGRRTHFAVRHGQRGVETARVSGDVASLLLELDGKLSLAELDARRPGSAAALARLGEAGLVGFRCSTQAGRGEQAQDECANTTRRETPQQASGAESDTAKPDIAKSDTKRSGHDQP